MAESPNNQEPASAPETESSQPAKASPEKSQPAPKEEPSSPKKKRTGAIPRMKIGVNVTVQIVLLLVLVLIANYLSFRHFERWDLSRDQRYSLSPKSISILEELDEPVQVIVRLSTTSRIGEDVDHLLREMQYIAEDNLEVEYVNPELDVSREKELQSQYRFRQIADLVIVQKDEEHRFIYENDMIELAPLDPVMAAANQAPDIAAFLGEQQLMSALIEVIEARRPRFYLSQGHNEPQVDADPNPLSLMLGYLEQENVEPLALRLSVAGEVPEDASAVAIIGPQYDFTLDEIKILEDYWNAGGRLLILLDPHSDTPNLRDFIRRRAVDPRDDRVLRSIRLTSDLVGIQPAVVAQFVRDSAITRGLEGANTILKGGTSSLGMDGGMANEIGLSLGGLMFAEEGYWGEVDHQAQEKYFNEGVDNEFPLPLAVSVEPLNAGDRDHRMIVIGNSEFLSNTNLKDASRDFALNSVNWLLDRDFLIEIPPRERDLSMLQLSPEQKRQILFYCVVLIPGIAAAVGLVIWLKRRR